MVDKTNGLVTDCLARSWAKSGEAVGLKMIHHTLDYGQPPRPYRVELTASNACCKSAMRSAVSSMPTE